MAYYNDVVKTNDLVERTLGFTSNLFKSMAERHARRRIYRATLNELVNLSDRELADLGIHRSRIKRIAWDAAVETTGNQ